MSKPYRSSLGSRPVKEDPSSLNFPALAEDFDALYVTKKARLKGWTPETTCWFRWRFSKVEEIGPLANYMKMPIDEFRWAMSCATTEEADFMLEAHEKLEREAADLRNALTTLLRAKGQLID